MNDIELRAAHLFVALACFGCGSGEPTDFFAPARGGTGNGGGGGVQSGGSGGAAPGGAGATPGGAGGVAQGGTGGAGQGGTVVAGSAGAGSGGATAGASGSSGSGAGATGGTGTVSFSCGPLTCVAGRQFCVRGPTPSGEGQMYMCEQFLDSCHSLDCSCFCGAPQNFPCGAAVACKCYAEAGVTVVCGDG
jgi:hypothetical protein